MAALLSGLAAPAAALEFRQYQHQGVTINICRPDQPRETLRMYWKDAGGAPLGTFARLDAMLRARNEELLCATNAGIYDKQLQPLGLYMEDGAVLRRLNTRQNAYGNFYLQPNGVFALGSGNGDAWLVPTTDWADHAEDWMARTRYATQSGPLMLVDGRINTLFDPNSANTVLRNAVCLGGGEVTLAIARNPISFHDFALFLRDRIGCTDALYLDGNISRMYPTLEAHIGPAFGAMIAIVRERAP